MNKDGDLYLADEDTPQEDRDRAEEFTARCMRCAQPIDIRQMDNRPTSGLLTAFDRENGDLLEKR